MCCWRRRGSVLGRWVEKTVSGHRRAMKGGSCVMLALNKSIYEAVRTHLKPPSASGPRFRFLALMLLVCVLSGP